MKSFVLFCAVAVLSGCASTPHAAEIVDVSVYDRTSGRELHTYRSDGKLYVAGMPGNKYSITVHNRKNKRVLTVVSVDGVNVINGETARVNQSGYVIDPVEKVEINGWRKSLDQVAAFVFTSVADSYAARTGRGQNVGVIGVAVFEEKVRTDAIAPEAREDRAGPAVPESTARAPLESSDVRSRQQLGTGHGTRETSHAYYTDFERGTAKPAQIIKIYYDSYSNLIARGVIPQPGWKQRLPDPFPEQFVPDPA